MAFQHRGQEPVYVPQPSDVDLFVRDTTSDLLLSLLTRQEENGELSAELLNPSCAPFPFPFDADAMHGVAGYAPKGQVPLYPANANTSYDNLDPDLMDLRLAHTIMKLR